LSGQSTWLKYSQEIQQRSLLACSLKVTNAKELRTQIFKILNQARDEGLLDTKLDRIHKLLKMSSQDRQQVVILGGLEKVGTKNFKRSKDIPHFSRVESHKPSSHCTPLSPPTYVVQGYDCALTKYPEAKFVTWFNWQRAIAFHAYTVPPYPASHGCVRLLTKNHGAEWIYDNSLAGITQIKINWDELDSTSKKLSPKCWSGDRLIPRPPQKPK
jgi:L,D-transpeptidase catalytic domain